MPIEGAGISAPSRSERLSASRGRQSLFPTPCPAIEIRLLPLLQHRLLHRNRLPATIPTDEDARIPDLAAEREAAERAGIVRDPSEHGDVAIQMHRQAVVSHRGEPQVAARDIANVVRSGPDLAEPGD